MKTSVVYLAIIAAAVQLCAAAGVPQKNSKLAAAFSYSITVSNGVGGSQDLKFGLDPAGTDGIDASLGELERPPLPPSEVFDARFIGSDIGLADELLGGLIQDYRQGDENTTGIRIHEVAYQVGTGSQITISWDFPNYLMGELQDIINGEIIDVMMTGKSSTVITNPGGISKLKMTLTYDAPLPITLVSFVHSITPENTVKLSWSTVSEIDNYGFEVQKSPADAKHFQSIANSFIPGAGTTTVEHDYVFEDPTTTPDTWYYRLKQTDLDGKIHYSEPLVVDVATSVAGGGLPTEFGLQQNFPNPFNPTTLIRFTVQKSGPATLSLYTVLGQKVATLYDGFAAAGRVHAVIFNGANLATGVYLYRLESGGSADVKKLIVTN